MTMRNSVSVLCAILIAGVAGVSFGLYVGGSSVGQTQEEMAILEETDRVQLDLKLAGLLRDGKTDDLQAYYDIAISCAPFGLNFFLEGTNSPKVAEEIEETISLANEYIRNHGVNHCQEAQ